MFHPDHSLEVSWLSGPLILQFGGRKLLNYDGYSSVQCIKDFLNPSLSAGIGTN